MAFNGKLALDLTLHLACEVGDVDRVEDLLRRGADPTQFNEQHETAFHVVCKSPMCGLTVLECMVKYVQERVTISSSVIDLDFYRDVVGRTPLHTALRYDKRDFALYLIKNRHCNAFAIDKNQVTPLYLACRDGNVVIVEECCRQITGRVGQDQCRELVKCMGAVEEKDSIILLDLCKCVEFEPLFTVMIESEKHALATCLVNRQPRFKNMKDYDLVDHACAGGHVRIVRYLLDTLPSPYATVKRLCDWLGTACNQGHVDLVEYFICEKNVKPTARNLCAAAKNGKLDVVKYLMNSDVQIIEDDHFGDSPLHAACRGGNLDVVKFLVDEKECDVDKKNNGNAPIHLAAAKGRDDIVQFLLDRKCQPFSLDTLEDTPLHLAALLGHAKLVKTLISCGASEALPMKNHLGRTPLHVVCTSNSLEALSVLLDSGLFDCNDQDKNGNTPLHIACRYRNERNIQLLYNKTTLSIKNKKGQTAMDAVSKGTVMSKTVWSITSSHVVCLFWL